jgi:hypothetical protein
VAGFQVNVTWRQFAAAFSPAGVAGGAVLAESKAARHNALLSWAVTATPARAALDMLTVVLPAVVQVTPSVE